MDAEWAELQGLSQQELEIAVDDEMPEAPFLQEDAQQLAAFMQRGDGARQRAESATPSETMYEPLRGEHDIRVLAVQPGRFDDDIHCTLRHCSTEFEYAWKGNDRRITRHVTDVENWTRLWYTALSYTWGPSTFTSRIVCNGHEKGITPNLEAAIRHLRAPTQTVHLWIDQLCIDQLNNPAEKSDQVRKMDMIYKRAYNTVIWLGSTDADEAFEILREIRATWQFTKAELSEDVYQRLNIAQKPPEAWLHLSRLFESIWFTRAWIIQEVALSRFPFVVSGRSTMSWSDFFGCCYTLSESGYLAWLERQKSLSAPPVSSAHRGLASSVALSLIANSATTSGPSPYMMGMLVDIRSADATDPRDKIYAVLGLLDVDVKADYSLEYFEIYRRAMVVELRYAWKHENRTPPPLLVKTEFDLLDRDAPSILSCVDHPPHELGPSWVPDWSQPRQTSVLGIHTSSYTTYSAGAGMGPPDATLIANDSVLSLNGAIVDCIAALGDTVSEPDLSTMDCPSSNALLVSLTEFASKCHPYPTGLSLFEVFWQTIVAGKDGSGRRKCPTDYADTMSLLLDESTGRQPSLPGQTYSTRRLKGHFTLTNLRSRQPAKTFQDLRKAFANAMRNRRMCISEGGLLGIVPSYALAGDRICIIPKYPVPFVLRPAGGPDTYRIIGECYIHGIMHGEARDRVTIRPIKIV